MTTRGTYGAPEPPVVVRWAVSGDAKANATKTEISFAVASDLPAMAFYGIDGMVDLPVPFALLSYTASGSPFRGEALLYSRDYDAVVSRAHVNGLYSAIAVDAAPYPLLVSSALSPFSATASDQNDNGLYVAPLCGDSLVAVSPCPAPRKLFGWTGASGPVAADIDGNVFVAASITGGAKSDAIHAAAYAELVRGEAVTDVTLAEIDSKGTSTLAAIGTDVGEFGWVVGRGLDAASPVYAVPFTDAKSRIAGAGKTVERALVPASGVSLSVFTDAEGDLWVAATNGTTGSFLELRRKKID